MNRSTSFLSAACYLLPVAIVTCASLSYAATANNQMSSLSDRLLEVGRYFGDGNGMIPVPVGESTTLYVATSDGTQPYSIYTGQPDESIAVIAACTVDSTGAPEQCHEAYGETMLFGIEDLLNEPEVSWTLPKVECHELIATQVYCKLTLSNGTEKCWLGNSSGVSVVRC